MIRGIESNNLMQALVCNGSMFEELSPSLSKLVMMQEWGCTGKTFDNAFQYTKLNVRVGCNGLQIREDLEDLIPRVECPP